MGLVSILALVIYVIMRTVYTCFIERQFVLESKLDNEWSEDYTEVDEIKHTTQKNTRELSAKTNGIYDDLSLKSTGTVVLF